MQATSGTACPGQSFRGPICAWLRHSRTNRSTPSLPLLQALNVKTMNINWTELESCGGRADASEIPRAIDLLFSSIKSEREKGYWGIDNHAVVQSDLYSSAPYAARAIVDRFLDEQVITFELVNIFFELHNGYGPQILEIGPLAGQSLDSLCKGIVRESEPLLSKQLNTLEPELAEEVISLIEAFNEPNI